MRCFTIICILSFQLFRSVCDSAQGSFRNDLVTSSLLPICRSSNANLGTSFASGNAWSYEPGGYHDFVVNSCCGNACARWGFIQNDQSDCGSQDVINGIGLWSYNVGGYLSCGDYKNGYGLAGVVSSMHSSFWGRANGTNTAACPPNTTSCGTSSGCICAAGFAGNVISISTYPFYIANCTPAACPANTTGINLSSGCKCNTGYSGSMAPTFASPYYASPCTGELVLFK